MFESNNFDKAVKAAEKLETILRRSKNLAALSGIESGLRSLSQYTAQTERLLQRTRLLARESSDLAYRQAGITKETYRRVKFYDQELAAVRRNRAQLQASAQAEQARFQNNKQRQQAANTAAQAAIAAEINRRSQLMNDLSAEYNLRMSMRGFDTDAVQVAQELAANNAKVLELQTKLKSIEASRLTIDNFRSQKLDNITNELKDQEKIEQSINSLKAADRLQQKAAQKQEFKEFITDKFAGGFAGQIAQLVKTVGKLGLVLAPLAIIALLIKAVVGKYIETLQTTIDLGLDASQRVNEISKATSIVGKSLAENKIMLDPTEVIKSSAALADTFGKLNIQTELVQRSAELSRLIGISAEEGAQLLEYFVRINKNSADTAAQQATTLLATAKINNYNPNKLVKEVAANAANFAKSSRASADELGRAAIYVSRLGTSLSTVSSIADRIATDFEGTLEAQANIGAFNPNFNQTGLILASQFGTDADIARELKAAVDTLGGNIEDMPRAQKLAYAQSLGVGIDELIKIANSEDGDISKILTPGDQAIVDATNGLTNEIQQAVANPLSSLEKGVFGIWSLLVNKFSSSADKVKAMDDKQLAKTAAGGGQSGDRLGFDARAALKETERRTLEKQIQDLSQIQAKTPDQKSRIERLTTSAQEKLDELNGVEKPNTTGKLPDKIQAKVRTFDVGGVVGGGDKKSFKSLSGLFAKFKSDEVPAILHKGEAVLNKSQMDMLGQLTGVQSGMAKSLTGFVNNFTEQIASPSGLIGKLTNTIAGNNSNSLLGTLSKTFGQGSGGIMSKITGAISGQTGGMLSSITKSLSGNGGLLGNITKSLSGGQGGASGIFGSITKSLGGGKEGGLFSSLTKSLTGGKGGGLNLGSITKSLSGGQGTGVMGKVSSLLGGNLKSSAANLVGKIPGIGGIASSLLKGGGIKGVGTSLLKGGVAKLGGAKIGATLGSVIPGAGTIVGALAGAGISKLANSRVGKAIGGFVSKTPIGQIGKKVLGTAGKAIGGIGKKLGGLFGRNKKTPPQVVPEPDMTQMANMSGMLSMMPNMAAANFQSGINFGGQTLPMFNMGQSGTQNAQALNTQALEAKFDTLISLFKSGGIAVNLDGKKVSDGLVDANRYG